MSRRFLEEEGEVEEAGEAEEDRERMQHRCCSCCCCCECDGRSSRDAKKGRTKSSASRLLAEDNDRASIVT